MRDGVPFELTPVQHAYLVGRSPQQTLGGVGCHLYQEFDGTGLTADALERAVDTLLARHPMLQVAFLPDGRQQWLERPVWPGVAVHDLRELSAPEQERRLLALRDTLSHRVLEVERGATFDFQLTLLPQGRHRLHVNLDLLVLDAASFTLIFEELAALVSGRALPPADSRYDFRSYLAQTREQTREAREHAIRYWRHRLPTLPAAPELPLAQEPGRITAVRIQRRRAELDAATWRAFKQHAGACGVTPTMALATAFGAVLARWSGQSRLLLNLTLFDRQPLDPAVERMIADFTRILLLDLACAGEGASATFDALARANQDAFTEAHEQRHWSGVEALRELKKENRHPHGAPVVFTSNLGRPLYGDGSESVLGEPAWGISQTPQVWLDHLAFEHRSSVWLQWDSNDALFPPGLIEALFNAYTALVHQLAAEPDAWRAALPDLMPQAQRDTRERVNATGRPVPEGLLHEAFFRLAERTPDAVALLHGEVQLSFAELAELARRCAGALAAHGVPAGATVAISMPKGIGQIIAVLGTLYAGAVYVPVPLDQPLARRRKIYKDAGVALVLVDAEVEVEVDASNDASATRDATDATDAARYLNWRHAVRSEPLAAPIGCAPAGPAYVIYTSGSTGMPKGVVISHRGALNTCDDLNRRYRVGPGERVLALSALHFDLSVYDIFGVLGAGGALVLLDERERRDPSVWCQLIERHQVSLWNSVPALFDMLLTYSEGFALDAPSRLRVALLSGDWIGLDLPARYRAFRPDGALVALGGATEASIWSNAFDVRDVPPAWRSIPYGFPLTNQRYRVVDALGRDCPDWVPGELWIGGVGVAPGYFNDAERSAQQFVQAAGERWYRTGDLGCYWPDGTLEFLGRRDKQVKIGGYRIELGEIDAALARIDGIKSGITLALGEREKSLAAFVVVAGNRLCTERQPDPALPSDYGALFDPGHTGASLASNLRHATDASESHEAYDARVARLVADFLHEHLQRQGFDFAEPLDADALRARYRAAPRWRGLFARWLALLDQAERLQGDADGRRVRGPHYETHALPLEPAEPLFGLADALASQHAALAAILRGERAAETLLDHPLLSPESLLQNDDGNAETLTALAEALERMSRELGRPVRVVEAGARSGLGGAALLERVGQGVLVYTALDESQEMVLRARERLAAYPQADVRRWDAAADTALRHSADVVLANNVLHRLGTATLGRIVALAAPSALLHVLERRAASALTLVGADLLNTDDDGASTPLRDGAAWRALFDAHGLHHERADLIGAQQRFVLRARAHLAQPDPQKIGAALAAQLPSYMLPQRLYCLDALPLTANGKIDHAALAALAVQPTVPNCTGEAPNGTAEQALAGLWQTLLEAPTVHRRSDFFELGGDSLLATRLIGALRQLGYDAQLGDLFDYPALAAFAATLRQGAAPTPRSLRHDAAARYTPFALTEVQQAYLVGRQPGFALSGVGSQFFVEFEVEDLDLPRFEAAWRWLIERHDMLRAIIVDGRQQVLPHVPDFVLRYHRLVSLDSADAFALRTALAHQVLDPSHWPVFDVQAAGDGGRLTRVYVCLDNLLLDGLSMQILLAELEQRYLAPDSAPPPLEIGFRDYLEQAAGLRASEAAQAVQAARTYWRRRLDGLPPAPQLPLARAPAEIGVPRFGRLSGCLTAERWQALKTHAAAVRITPSALLLSAFAAVLSAWSARRDLCVNLTLFDRRPVHPQIERVLGDFTSLLLVAWQPDEHWLDSAQRLQQRLWRDLEQRDVSGLWVMRELALRRGRASTEMPVVFTSALGFDTDRFLAHASWLKPRWGISQTPQVWLDHQVYESEGELRFNWDVVEALFEPDLLRAMFGQYVALLHRLADEAPAWRLPLDTLVPRATQALAQYADKPAAPAPGPIVPTPASAPAPGQAALANEATQALIDTLRGHFHQVVGSPIAAGQNFFEAGATSLKLVQLHIQLQQAGYGALTLTDLFAHPSPQALAALLAGAAPLADPRAIRHTQRHTRHNERHTRRTRRQGAA